jgi:hypothetical protein
VGDLVIGVLAAHEDRELAEALAEQVPDALGERADHDVSYRTEVRETDPADASADAGELIEAVRRRVLDGGWGLGIGLTSLPLRDGRRPVVAQASASHGVGLVSVPALGALHRDRRLRDTVADLVAGLLSDDGTGPEPEEPITLRDAEEHGTLRFAGQAIFGNLRLLIGMIRVNRPTRVMARLSRSATAALGTGAYAVTSANLWSVAEQSSLARLIAIGLLSLALILVALVVAHGLWERTREAAARERVVLFNVVTVATLAIGVATLYLVLFVAMVVAAAVMIPPRALADQIGHDAGIVDFLRLAWFAASVATVGGAFGSLIESDEAVRDAAYRQG